MKIVKGDLLKLAEEGKFDLILHGCNCFNTMGAGIAKQIKDRYPEAYETDKNESIYGDIEKLGSYTVCSVITGNHSFNILNAYTQYDFKGKNNVDYNAIKKVFHVIGNTFRHNNKNIRIGYPMIGASLAGGNWDIISKIIDEELKDLDHTLVVYNKGETK